MEATSGLFGRMLQPEALMVVGASVLLLVAIVILVRPGRRVMLWLGGAVVLTLGVTAGVLMLGPTPDVVLPASPDPLAAPTQATIPTPADPGASVVAVALGEWDLTVTTVEVRPGSTTFEVHNLGRLPHALRLRSDDEGPRREWRSALIAPGERLSMTLDLTTGVYELDCPIESVDGEHDALGMEVRFLVREAAPPPVTAADEPPAPARDEEEAPSSTDRAAAVAIAHFAFAPGHVRVAPGARITWHNEDAAPHSATGEGWGTEQLALGETASVTFTDLGEHPYRCDLHPAMTGTILVAEP